MPRETWCTSSLREPFKKPFGILSWDLSYKNWIQKGKGDRKYVIFLSESFKYLTTGSSGIKCIHLTLAWTPSRQAVLQRKEEKNPTPTITPEAVLRITALWWQSQGKRNSFYREHLQTVILVSHTNAKKKIKLSPAPWWEEADCFYCYKSSGTPWGNAPKRVPTNEREERKKMTTLPSEMD